MRLKPVIVLGAGGHAKVCIDVLQCMGREVFGIVAPEGSVKKILGVKYLGDEGIIFKFDPNEIELVNGIGMMPGKQLRKKIYIKFKKMKYKFATIIHPSAVVSQSATLGEGVHVMAGAIIQPFVRIDCNTIINTKTSIDHDCVISSHCHLAPGVTICGGVTIGVDVFIGCGSSVIQAVKIDADTVINAGICINNNMIKRINGSY